MYGNFFWKYGSLKNIAAKNQIVNFVLLLLLVIIVYSAFLFYLSFHFIAPSFLLLLSIGYSIVRTRSHRIWTGRAPRHPRPTKIMSINWKNNFKKDNVFNQGYLIFCQMISFCNAFLVLASWFILTIYIFWYKFNNGDFF